MTDSLDQRYWLRRVVDGTSIKQFDECFLCGVCRAHLSRRPKCVRRQTFIRLRQEHLQTWDIISISSKRDPLIRYEFFEPWFGYRPAPPGRWIEFPPTWGGDLVKLRRCCMSSLSIQRNRLPRSARVIILILISRPCFLRKWQEVASNFEKLLALSITDYIVV